MTEDSATLHNVTLEEWEGQQVEYWKFQQRLWKPYHRQYWAQRLPFAVIYAWAMFRMWLWKRMRGPDDG